MNAPTPEQIAELDAWIAEHVMGWRWLLITATDKLGSDQWYQLIHPDEKWPNRWQIQQVDGPDGKHPDYTDLSCFKPTTDPAAAMQVLEKCVAARKNIHIKWGDRCYCVWDGWFEAFAPTLPLAICLFAKKLYGN